MAESVTIHGTCDKKFVRVKEAFAENFRAGKEAGAALAVTIDNTPVVDLWGGIAIRKDNTPWQEDTLVNVYSTTKGLTAMCAHRLVDAGKLDLDAPVAKYWPEFAQNGKGDIPVKWLLCHKAGLPAIAKPLPGPALYEWDTMCAALAEQAPWWTPGTKHGYHALTFGWLVGEVVRRISGKSLGKFFEEEIARPLGLDCHIGLHPDHDKRCAHMAQLALFDMQKKTTSAIGKVAMERQKAFVDTLMKSPNTPTTKAFMNPPTIMQPGSVNTRDWRGAEIPAANGHTTARSLAKVYGVLACGGALGKYRLLTPESITRCYTEQAYGPDAVLLTPSRFGLGFMLSQKGPGEQFGPNAHVFGHPGAGGSVGYADCDAHIGFGYTMNQMGVGLLLDERPAAIIDAVYACL